MSRHMFLVLMVFPFFLSGCSSVAVDDYKDERPTLVLEDYLNGNIEAVGFFQNRSGKIVKRFHVAMKATWQGANGLLEEDFVYSDGTKSRRVWKIKKTDSGRYVGTADDVIGEAHGESSGNAFRWKYTLALPVDGSVYHVHFDDWMWLMDDQIMMNKSKMSKFGFELGEVVLTFIKRSK